MKLTTKQRAELVKRFGGRCAYCGSQLPEKGWHADHIEREGEREPESAAAKRPLPQTGKDFIDQLRDEWENYLDGE